MVSIEKKKEHYRIMNDQHEPQCSLKVIEVDKLFVVYKEIEYRTSEWNSNLVGYSKSLEFLRLVETESTLVFKCIENLKNLLKLRVKL